MSVNTFVRVAEMSGNLSENFDRSEFACHDNCGFDTVDVELIQVLEDLRHHFNSPVHVDDGCRCPAHNASVGGEPHSQHMLGRAADIRVEGVEPNQVQEYMMETYPNEYGVGRYDTFTHVDTRTSGPARWDLRSSK